MIDGPTESSDRSSTAANKTVVRAFVEDIFIERDMTKLDRCFDGNNYINHNPRIADGVDRLRDRLLSTTRTPFRFDTMHMVLGEGDFVLVVTEGTFGDRNTSFKMAPQDGRGNRKSFRINIAPVAQLDRASAF
jgi:predicted SnoaL-like aldol condensation-catalyzing enzyme